jgi:predicted nucleic acid-binding protein
MIGKTLLGTNVLIYLFDEDSPAKQARARELFGDYARSRKAGADRPG